MTASPLEASTVPYKMSPPETVQQTHMLLLKNNIYLYYFSLEPDQLALNLDPSLTVV